MTQRTVTSEWGREVQETELARLSNGLSDSDEEKENSQGLFSWVDGC